MTLKHSLYSTIQNVGVKYPMVYTLAYKSYVLAGNLRDRFRFGSPLFNIIAIENSTFCNRKCYYCPNVKHQTPEKFMDEGTYHKIVDGLKSVNFGGIVHFNFYNEPLLDSRLPLWISYCRKQIPSAILKVNSNGDYLTADMARVLQESGLTSVCVTIHDLKGEAAFARISEIQNEFPNMIKIRSIHQAELYNRGGAVNVKRPATGTRCIEPLREIIMDYQGNVLMCCNDYFHQHIFGNVHQKDLAAIWFDPAYQRRYEHVAGVAG